VVLGAPERDEEAGDLGIQVRPIGKKGADDGTGARKFGDSLGTIDPLRPSVRRTAAGQRPVFPDAEEGNRTPQIPRNTLGNLRARQAKWGIGRHELLLW